MYIFLACTKSIIEVYLLELVRVLLSPHADLHCIPWDFLVLGTGFDFHRFDSCPAIREHSYSNLRQNKSPWHMTLNYFRVYCFYFAMGREIFHILEVACVICDS